MPSIERHWNRALKRHQTIQSNDPLYHHDLESAVRFVGESANFLFPSLLEMGKSVPFVGPIAAITLQTYGNMVRYVDNKHDLSKLNEKMLVTLEWLHNNATSFSMLPTQQMNRLEMQVKMFVEIIGEIDDMISEWKRRHPDSHLILTNDQDKERISSLTDRIGVAVNTISLHSTGILFELQSTQLKNQRNEAEMKIIRECFGDTFVVFDTDIKTHLKRFVPGSRNWMHSVS
jgi:hypothetical protein